MLGHSKNKINKKQKIGRIDHAWYIKPWFSYISYVFHGAIKARGNPQCLQPLLNITRFGPRGHILWLGRLLERGERGGAVGVEERKEEKGGRKLEVKAKCLKCNNSSVLAGLRLENAKDKYIQVCMLGTSLWPN